MSNDDAMIERVARAIWDVGAPEHRMEWDEETSAGKERYLCIARAALSAMPPRDEEDDTVLRISSINEHGEAPDGSVWRNIVINGEHYTIPYEVAMWFVHRGDQRDAQRELLREALTALDRVLLNVEFMWEDGALASDAVADLRRARAAADKIRAALGGEK